MDVKISPTRCRRRASYRHFTMKPIRTAKRNLDMSPTVHVTIMAIAMERKHDVGTEGQKVRLDDLCALRMGL